MEFKGTIKGISRDIITKQYNLTFKTKNVCIEELECLKDKELNIILKQYKNKRSLNANAYFWKLCTEIANILRANKDDVYLDMLKKYGQSQMVSIISYIDVSGYFKYYEEAGKSILNNKEFTHYKIYKGSSEFDTKEMSILIDGIVSDAKELGIQTLDDLEIKSMIGEWK